MISVAENKKIGYFLMEDMSSFFPIRAMRAGKLGKESPHGKYLPMFILQGTEYVISL